MCASGRNVIFLFVDTQTLFPFAFQAFVRRPRSGKGDIYAGYINLQNKNLPVKSRLLELDLCKFWKSLWSSSLCRIKRLSSRLLLSDIVLTYQQVLTRTWFNEIWGKRASTFVKFRPLSSTLVDSCPLSSTLVNSRQLSSTLVHYRRLSSTLVHSRRLSSNLVNCCPLSSALVNSL